MKEEKHTRWKRDQLSTDQVDGWPQDVVDRVQKKLAGNIVDDEGNVVLRFERAHPDYESNAYLVLQACNTHDQDQETIKELVKACERAQNRLRELGQNESCRTNQVLATAMALAKRNS